LHLKILLFLEEGLKWEEGLTSKCEALRGNLREFKPQCWVWWYMPVIPTFLSLSQED
jgi:hypothetical protein